MVTNNNLKIVFAGGGPFAEPLFAELVEKFKDLTLIVKRGTPTESKIWQISQKNSIKVLNVSNKEEFHTGIQKLTPDIVIVVSFGIIISKKTLDIPKHGFINVHYSMLPKYRGPSPVQAAILAGDSISGITFQKMAPVIDEGDTLYQEEVGIKPHDTTETLARRMAKISALKLPKIINEYINNQIPLVKQTGVPTYSRIIRKSDGTIDWDEPAEIIERKIRAYTPWPSSYTSWNGKMLKILEATVLDNESGQKNGTFTKLDSRRSLSAEEIPASARMTKESENDNGVGYGIQTGKGTLIINKLQLEGKKPLIIGDFMLGNSKIVGEILG